MVFLHDYLFRFSVDSELAEQRDNRKGSFTGVDFFQAIVCGGDDSDSDSSRKSKYEMK